MAISTGVVTVNDTATMVTSASAGVSGARVVIENRDATDAVDIGASDVTFGAGFRLDAGDQLALELTAGEDLWAIADAALTADVQFIITGE